MPRKIVLQDGSEMEVPTEEELGALKTKATQADTLSTQIADLQKQKEALENDPVNKNFRELRTINQKLTDALRAQGKTVKEDGTVVEEKPALTAEEIEAKAKKAASEVLIESKKKSAFAKFDDEKRKVVEHYFNKLTSGEQIDDTNLDKFVEQAYFLADPAAATAQKTNKYVHVNGTPPRFQNTTGQSFADSDAGKKIADELFGSLSYTKKNN